MKLLIIGLSKISKAFLKNYNNTQEIDIYSPNSSLEGFACYHSFKEIHSTYTHIFLGCKPQHIESVANNLPQICYNQNTIFMSVLAGITTDKISKKFNVQKVFRIMPSIAFEFEKSFLAWHSTGIDEESLQEIKAKFGENTLIQCKNEEEINNFTAIYGSGIGFVFEIMNAFFETKYQPYTTKQMREIVLNIFENACTYMKNHNELSFRDAVYNVASKGGTTEAGLEILQKNKISDIIENTIFSSLKRAKDLGK